MKFSLTREVCEQAQHQANRGLLDQYRIKTAATSLMGWYKSYVRRIPSRILQLSLIPMPDGCWKFCWLFDRNQCGSTRQSELSVVEPCNWKKGALR